MKTYEGLKIDALTSQFGLQQLIQEPKHILTNSSSWIDLIFTSQPNLLMESAAHPFLYQNCCHQLIYTKINLKVFYPLPYGREIRHYMRANVYLVQRATEQFSWGKSFRNLSINEMIFLFNNVIKNIFSNFIPTKQPIGMTENHLGLTTTSSG